MVSIIIPTYKRTAFLKRAIESVLNQNYPDIEIIVVDDNGEGEQQEDTRKIVELYNSVKLITYKVNKGGCYARNRGAELAKGDILMFLDDDDYFLINKISKHIEPLLIDDTIDMSLCSVKIHNENGVVMENNLKYPRGNSFKTFVLNGHVFTLMIAIRTSIFRKLGGFDPIPRFQDKFFMYKFFTNNYKVKFVKEELLVVVEHDNLRVSSKNFKNEAKALTILHEFEKNNFSLFNKKEQLFLRNKYYMSMALIRINESLRERMSGILYLLKCNWFLNNDVKNKIKILIQLIFTGNRIQKLKNKIENIIKIYQ